MRSKKKLKALAEKAEKATTVDEPGMRQLKAEIRRLHNLLRKARSGEALIVDAVREVYEIPVDLELPKRPQKAKRKKLKEEAWLHVSDTQIGKRTSTYSTEVARERLMMLAEKTIEVANIRRASANVDTLHILFGGDMIEGETIFAGQAWSVDSDLFDQAVKNGPAMLSQMVLRLAEEFPNVKISTVPGNHGRSGPRNSGVSKRTNWDNVLYEVTKLMVMGPEDSTRNKKMSKHIDFHISPRWYTVQNVAGWGILGVHGDTIRSSLGFPWYGVGKKAFGWIDSIPEEWTYLALGHFHTYATAVMNKRIMLANGTTESDNTYAQSELAAAGDPCQRLAFFERKHGMISDTPIFLGGNRKPDYD